jgi:transposase
MTPADDKQMPEQMAKVLELHLVRGLGVRAIARELKIGRKRVSSLLGLAHGKRKPAALAPTRSSILDPYEALVREALKDCPEIRAPAVLDRLRREGYQGGITVVRDRLRVLRPKPKQEAFFTCSYEPGQVLQVDWADFGYAIPGCARRVSAFVAALAHSRMLFLCFVLSQAMGSFLRCMDAALRFFGGRTMVDVFDNMRTVVKERTGQHVVFNQRFLEYARVRGFAVRACTPRRPTEKPYVERPIGFVRSRFWPGRRFKDLFDLNAQATTWRDDTANNRIHEETGKVPALVFKHLERQKLEPVPELFFDTDDLESCTVSKTFRVAFDRNVYSVPWKLVGQPVLVRADNDRVSVFLGPKCVAVHKRIWAVGEVGKDDAHEVGLLEQKPRAAAQGLPAELRGLGDIAANYFKILAANARSLRREVQQLVLLCELFGESPTRSAIEEVMATGHVGSEYVEYVLRHKRGLSPTHAPLKLGDAALDGIRLGEPDLSAYDRPRKTLDPGEPPETEKS